ncbi:MULTISPECIES: beta-3-deoxy-D-manno-oct-2-ulosonic acid transferase [Rhizobium/Agrobacterium group]|uniref:Capsular biosynthesis protein n=1 Tax=Pararhizobium antarcticum TaxID=1798805 RepID=A0A657LW84_9HYPH|nr:capsular biosynthesis protein [Pararhizobium antarcticum]OJF98943.1 capsular biosynthesis protein [Pararhizobium antarcticum]OJF99173.1 capsular biosynthesis protein [Rhizobium sp. 58]
MGLRPWKDHVGYWLSGEDVVRRERWFFLWQFFTLVAPQALAARPSKIYVWGYKYPRLIEPFCRFWNIPIVRIEDGFLRSVALGATKAPPLSLCFDTSSMYFDATMASDMEKIIENHDFSADPALLARGKAGMDRLILSRLSKYNMGGTVDIAAIYGPKHRKRVLVVGQVEGDASIIKGCSRRIDNNDLVAIAAKENPDAQIIYKPHPEVLHRTRRGQSDPDKVRAIAMVLDRDLSLSDAFETVDHVYTITSLAGFEALIRGIRVTCLGMPFYAGWGATDDRQPCPRRTARRSVVEIFTAAYILYPKYFDPARRAQISFEEALDLLASMKDKAGAHGKQKHGTTRV